MIYDGLIVVCIVFYFEYILFFRLNSINCSGMIRLFIMSGLCQKFVKNRYFLDLGVCINTGKKAQYYLL